MNPDAPPRALTIAGSDSGGGAGIQADLKTFAAHGVYGMSAVTAITAQNTLEVRDVHPVPATIVRSQIAAVFDDLGVDAVKIGMLAQSDIVVTVAECLRGRAVPIVLDPVMVAKSGARLLAEEAEEALATQLLPLATVVTPNLPEAESLLGRRITWPDDALQAARELARSGPAVLLKGGHGEGDEVEDVLVSGTEERRFRHARLTTRSDHGTGCTLSSAIAAHLARGVGLVDSVTAALDYLAGALATAAPLGAGHGPVNHFFPAGPSSRSRDES